jgi:hypothetical protein
MVHVTPQAARARAAVLPIIATEPALPHLKQVLRSVTQALFDPYRPELHYMRGPGPKWHEKHGRRHRDRRN